MREIASNLGFTVVAGDTDSLFLDDNNDDGNRIHHFIAECKKEMGIDVEHSQTFAKVAIIKKKHYFGVTTNGEIKVVGMEGKKNDRPVWINRVFDQFLDDFEADEIPLLTYDLQLMILNKEELILNF